MPESEQGTAADNPKLIPLQLRNPDVRYVTSSKRQQPVRSCAYYAPSQGQCAEVRMCVSLNIFSTPTRMACGLIL